MRYPGLCLLLCLAAVLPATASEPLRTRNVILITLDGVRPAELFGGLDETIAAHSATQVYSEIDLMRQRFGAPTPEARRKALMPTLWGTLIPRGVVFGNRALGSRVEVANPHRVSSPGYVELMTGAPREEVVDNSPTRYPYPTAFEIVAAKRGFGFAQVAQIGSWDGFALAASSREGVFLMSGGFDALPPAQSTPVIDRLAGLRKEVLGLWEEGSDDVLSFRIALEYLKTHEPRLLWIGLGNSDDWAHADRYDRLLAYLHLADRLIGELWQTLQSMEAYRDRTTLILTTDHGRGLGPADWAEHDVGIPGSEQAWIAVIGPDTPATGEARGGPVLQLAQVAATVLQFQGIGPAALAAGARAPLPGTLLPGRVAVAP